MKTVVILLVVLNLLAAFFLMPANNGITKISSSTEMSASGLALLSEVEVELKTPVDEQVEPITVVESIPVVKESFLDKSLITQEPAEPSKLEQALEIVTPQSPKTLVRETTAFQCGAVHGIKTIDAANRLKTKLAELKAKNFVIATSDQVSNKYWVYLGPYRTKQEAIDVNAKLRERNREGYFFSNNEVRNSISLGVFSSAVNAQRLQARLNELGYRTKTWHQLLTLFVLTADVPIDAFLVSKAVITDGYMIQTCN
ncbi:MAG: hypothetical protein ACJA1X_001089 [Bermanella sp.]